MNILKIITYLNWAVVAILAFAVIADTLSPGKGGGDAAGQALAQAFYKLAILALVVLLVLNLLPFAWAKYTAFTLVLIPVLVVSISPVWTKWKRNVRSMVEFSEPIFEDTERDRLARAIRDGNPEKVQELLQNRPKNLNQNGELLAYAINEASSAGYRPQEKIACVRLLLEAGADLDSAATDGVPIHMAVASNGNADLLRLLLEHGADPNAGQVYFNRVILFEALGGYQQPEATVRALLEKGANPNVTAIMDDDQGPTSPLLQAAEMGRWGVCVALLEKGADPNFKRGDGKTFRDYVQAAELGFSPDGYSTREDFQRLKKVFQ